MKRIQVEIRGITPLLIHRFGEQSEQAKPTRRQMSVLLHPLYPVKKLLLAVLLV